MPENTQWEYRAISVGSFWTMPADEQIELAMNELGEEGWEIFGVFAQHGNNRVRIVAKRKLSEADRRRRDWPA